MHKLRAIASFYNISITGLRHTQLVGGIMIKKYFQNSPTIESDINNYSAYQMALNLYNGMTTAQANIQHQINVRIVQEYTRRFHIDRLYRLRNMYTPFSARWSRVVEAIESENPEENIQDLFGTGVTVNDVFQIIPSIYDYLRNIPNIRLGNLLNYEILISDLEDDGFVDDHRLCVSVNSRLNVSFKVDESFVSAETCCVCFENTEDTYLKCKHSFCRDCVKKILVIAKNDSFKKNTCPMCRSNIDEVHSNNNDFIQDLVTTFV
jgi:hypothetical protein